MERFVHRENIERFRRLIAQATDHEHRLRLMKLLAEEEAKDSSPPKQD